jgi:hypothetical protein
VAVELGCLALADWAYGGDGHVGAQFSFEYVGVPFSST